MTEFIFKAQKNENTKNIPGEISLAESDLNKDTYNDSELFTLVASLQMEIYAPSYYVSGTAKALVLVDEGYKKFFSNEYDVDEKVEKIEIQELAKKIIPLLSNKIRAYSGLFSQETLPYNDLISDTTAKFDDLHTNTSI